MVKWQVRGAAPEFSVMAVIYYSFSHGKVLQIGKIREFYLPKCMETCVIINVIWL